LVTVAEFEHIFRIALTRDWEAAKRVGEYRISTLGKTLDEVGFIHGSFRHQVERIGSFLYSAVSEPITVLEVDPSRVAAPVRVENLEGGPDLFPHIYGALPVDAVVASLPASISGGRLVVEWIPAR
jgi:uncharacterized protein (DUF952 family)